MSLLHRNLKLTMVLGKTNSSPNRVSNHGALVQHLFTKPLLHPFDVNSELNTLTMLGWCAQNKVINSRPFPVFANLHHSNHGRGYKPNWSSWKVLQLVFSLHPANQSAVINLCFRIFWRVPETISLERTAQRT